jgi:hypothetical protein
VKWHASSYRLAFGSQPSRHRTWTWDIKTSQRLHSLLSYHTNDKLNTDPAGLGDWELESLHKRLVRSHAETSHRLYNRGQVAPLGIANLCDQAFDRYRVELTLDLGLIALDSDKEIVLHKWSSLRSWRFKVVLLKLSNQILHGFVEYLMLKFVLRGYKFFSFSSVQLERSLLACGKELMWQRRSFRLLLCTITMVAASLSTSRVDLTSELCCPLAQQVQFCSGSRLIKPY